MCSSDLGNKRVSVLRHFGSPRITGTVTRLLPPLSEEPRIKAYYEFIEFYKASRLYCVQFRRPGDYAKLLAKLGKQPGDTWTEEERRNFNAYFHYFRAAFCAVSPRDTEILPEEALLLWLEIYPYQDLGKMTAPMLEKSVAALWADMVTGAKEDAVKVETKAEDATKGSLIDRLITGFDQLHVKRYGRRQEDV